MASQEYPREEAKKLEEGTVMEALVYMLYIHLIKTDETSDDDQKTPRK